MNGWMKFSNTLNVMGSLYIQMIMCKYTLNGVHSLVQLQPLLFLTNIQRGGGREGTNRAQTAQTNYTF